MGFIDSDTSTFTTTAGGAGSVTTKRFTGLLNAIQWVPDAGAGAFSTAGSVTVSAERSGFNILVAALTSTVAQLFSPRVSIHSTAGSTIAGFDKLPLKDEGLTFTFSSGGASKTGAFRTFVE